ncbi:MAG: PD-(D/E)XK nuclease family protein, partial [Thermodesulfobacteriota bacterium]
GRGQGPTGPWPPPPINQSTMLSNKVFPSAAALQGYLLKEAGPGVLVVVPHRRLAHQVWHRQRLANLKQGRSAWEPLSLVTLQDWWADLFRRLWLPVAPAPALLRWARWLQAIPAAPPLAGVEADLEWAKQLDETHSLLSRHLLPTSEPLPDDPPLIAWRRQVTRLYLEQLQREGWITPGEVPVYLLQALSQGKIVLPETIIVVGLETPAPVEETWLEAVAAHTRLIHLQVKGHPQAVQGAYVFPDRDQEMEWVAAKLVELAGRKDLALHRLAVTSPDLDNYAPGFKRVLRELLGPPEDEGGFAYNFSQGPSFGETPLFQAALLPWKFVWGGERREDLMALVLSPYYELAPGCRNLLPEWDRVFRERRLEQGWEHLRAAVARRFVSQPEIPGLLARLDRVVDNLRGSGAAVRDWLSRLTQSWQDLGFPFGLGDREAGQLSHLTALLADLEAAWGKETLPGGELIRWLAQAAGQILLPGPGIQEAGIQILGLLEMRGLDFDRVFCLGLNSGVLPEPPRPLFLLSPKERPLVLGGTYESQYRFARGLWDNLLAAAPHQVLSRPRLVANEEQVATPLWAEYWEEKKIVPLGQAHPAWLRAPAIRAAFTAGASAPVGARPEPRLSLPVPAELSLTQVQTALGCPCRFLLEILLEIRELPEIEAGLPPRDRGDRLHQVLYEFGRSFPKVLAETGGWNHEQAVDLLYRVAGQLLEGYLTDLDWQAEWERWFGGEEDVPGLLTAWLKEEEARFAQGWRWAGVELAFQGLTGPDWPFTLKGRIDRCDYHGEEKELIVWDYKSGVLPSAKQVFERLEEFQLPGYLLAVKQGRVQLPPEVSRLRAGFIGLKSTRESELKHQDFPKDADRWEEVLAAWEGGVARLGQRLRAGEYGPEPIPAPEKNRPGACAYCPYPLVCGFNAATGAEENGEEE